MSTTCAADGGWARGAAILAWFGGGCDEDCLFGDEVVPFLGYSPSR